MEGSKLDGVREDTDVVAPLLGRAPARHNLILGLLDVLARRPDSYEAYHLWAVRDDARVLRPAMQTPPSGLVLADPIVDAPLAPLAAAIVEAGFRLPGVVGGVAEAD